MYYFMLFTFAVNPNSKMGDQVFQELVAVYCIIIYKMSLNTVDSATEMLSYFVAVKVRAYLSWQNKYYT